jgi:cell division septation protein DedD
MRTIVLFVWLALAGAGQVAAQAAAGTSLDSVEQLIESHRFADARSAIAHWWERSGAAARGDERAHGLFLRAVLSPDPADSEADLLRVAVEHPGSPYADRSLYRLAQFRLIGGDSADAGALLDRLLRDHPSSGERDRATALRASLGAHGRTAERASTAAPRAAPAERPSQAPAQRPAQQPAQRPAQQPAAAGTGGYQPGVDWTVQVGAFTAVAEAEALRGRLRAAGYDAYLARVGGDGRTLVRVGTFRDRAAAEAMQRRLRAAGYTGEAAAINLP